MSTVKRVSGDYTLETINAGDVVNLNSPFVNINGNLTVSGNAVLVGNINADKIFNGTTSIEIPVTNGNANVTVGGTSNVVVFAATGEYITLGAGQLLVEEDGAQNGLAAITAAVPAARLSDGELQLWNPDQSKWHTIYVKGAAGAEYLAIGPAEA